MARLASQTGPDGPWLPRVGRGDIRCNSSSKECPNYSMLFVIGNRTAADGLLGGGLVKAAIAEGVCRLSWAILGSIRCHEHALFHRRMAMPG